MEINLKKIFHNAHSLVTQLKRKGISVTGVTKACLGSPEIANTWLLAGVREIGDSRIENIITLSSIKNIASMLLIRTPMLSQVDEIVAHATVSLNSELRVIRELSRSAQKANRIHKVILMIELGDLREGLMPSALEQTIRSVLKLPNILFIGIGANLACRSGVIPDSKNMSELSKIADSIDAIFGPIVKIVSGGNSANLEWALAKSNSMGRINNLRLGESLLLGCNPLDRKALKGLHSDAINLVAEVIELQTKPSQPSGNIGQSAFGGVTNHNHKVGTTRQAILAIGRQDIDPDGITPPAGIQILAASSDHLILDISDSSEPIEVGSEIAFTLNYSALLCAMTSPFVAQRFSYPSELDTPKAQ